MKSALIRLKMTCILFILVLGIASCSDAKKNQVVAMVNGRPITATDLQAATPLDHKDDAAVRREVLELLIDRQLFLQEFERRGFQLESQTVDDAVADTIKAQYGDRAKFTEALSKRGLTLAAYEQTVREKIIVSAMQSFIAKEATNALTEQRAIKAWLTDARTKARIEYKP